MCEWCYKSIYHVQHACTSCTARMSDVLLARPCLDLVYHYLTPYIYSIYTCMQEKNFYLFLTCV